MDGTYYNTQYYTCVYKNKERTSDSVLWCTKGLIDDVWASKEVYDKLFYLPRYCPERFHRQILEKKVGSSSFVLLPDTQR